MALLDPTGAPVAPAAPARHRPELADALKHLARRVESGDVTSVALAHAGPGGSGTLVQLDPPQAYTLLGLLTWLQGNMAVTIRPNAERDLKQGTPQ
jgi:hypothetical protein